MEGAAAGAGQVRDDCRDDAAGRAGDHEYGLAAEDKPVSSVAERDLAQADGPPAARGPADLDGARIAQRLLDQRVGERSRLPGDREVDHLGQHVGPFPAVGLGESGHGPAERRHGARLVVAVVAAQAGRRHQERALRPEVAFGVEAAHHRVQVLDPDLERGPPACQVQFGNTRLGIERRKPVEPVDRPVAEPGGQLRVDVRGTGSRLEHQRGRAESTQPADEHVSDAALVGHHDDPLGLVQRDSGGGAPLDRRAQYRSRNPARQSAGRGGIAGERGRGVCLRGLGLRDFLVGRDLLRDFLAGRDLGLWMWRAVAGEADDVAEGGEVAEPHVLIAGDAELLAHGGEHLGLLDGVDAQVGFEVEIEVEQFGRVAGHVRDDLHDLADHRIIGGPGGGRSGRCGGGLRSCGRRRRCGSGWRCLSLRGGRRGGRSGPGRLGLGDRSPVAGEADDVGEGGEVAEPHVLIAGDAELLAHGGEHLGLLDGVDAQVGFEVEIEVEQFGRVAGHVRDDLHDLADYRVLGGCRGSRGRCLRSGGCCGRRCCCVRLAGGRRRGGRRPGVDHFAAIAGEADDVGEGGEVAEPHVLIAGDAELLAHGGEHLGLLNGVDAQVGFEVEIEVEQFGRVAGHVADDLHDLADHRIPGSRRSGRGRCLGSDRWCGSRRCCLGLTRGRRGGGAGG